MKILGFALLILLLASLAFAQSFVSPYEPPMPSVPPNVHCRYTSTPIDCSACCIFGSPSWAVCQNGYLPKCRAWWLICNPSPYPPA